MNIQEQLNNIKNGDLVILYLFDHSIDDINDNELFKAKCIGWVVGITKKRVRICWWEPITDHVPTRNSNREVSSVLKSDIFHITHLQEPTIMIPDDE